MQTSFVQNLALLEALSWTGCVAFSYLRHDLRETWPIQSILVDISDFEDQVYRLHTLLRTCTYRLHTLSVTGPWTQTTLRLGAHRYRTVTHPESESERDRTVGQPPSEDADFSRTQYRLLRQ